MKRKKRPCVCIRRSFPSRVLCVPTKRNALRNASWHGKEFHAFMFCPLLFLSPSFLVSTQTRPDQIRPDPDPYSLTLVDTHNTASPPPKDPLDIRKLHRLDQVHIHTRILGILLILRTCQPGQRNNMAPGQIVLLLKLADIPRAR